MHAGYQAVTPGDEQKKSEASCCAHRLGNAERTPWDSSQDASEALGPWGLGSLDLKHKNPPPLFLHLFQFRALVMEGESVRKVLDPDWRSLQLVFTCVWIPEPRYSSETITHSPFPSVDCWAPSLRLSTQEVANDIFAMNKVIQTQVLFFFFWLFKIQGMFPGKEDFLSWFLWVRVSTRYYVTNFVRECRWPVEGLRWSGWLGERSSMQRIRLGLHLQIRARIESLTWVHLVWLHYKNDLVKGLTLSPACGHEWIKRPDKREGMWLMLVLCMPGVGSRKTSRLDVLSGCQSRTDLSHWVTRTLLPTEHPVLGARVQLGAKSAPTPILEFLLTLEVDNATSTQKVGKHGKEGSTGNAGRTLLF